MISELLPKRAGADAGFPVGEGVDPQCGHFSVKMYVKMKEIGPIGGRAPENFVCRSANAEGNLTSD